MGGINELWIVMKVSVAVRDRLALRYPNLAKNQGIARSRGPRRRCGFRSAGQAASVAILCLVA